MEATSSALPRLGTRYRLIREIGRGGMGIVYLAEDRLYRRRVALKVLLNEIGDPKVERRFRREAGSLARLDHENIVAFYGVGEAEGRSFFAMEYVEGVPVPEHLRSHPRPLARAVELAAQVAAALEHAHARDLVHRDLKPENLLVNGEGRIKVMDFGLARSLFENRRLTSTGAVIGTVNYLSPEQASAEMADPRSDLYSLGVVLYEWLCGRLPFDSEDPLAVLMMHINERPPPPRTYNPAIPPDLEDLVLRLLEKDPRRRPESAAEVREHLERLAASLEGGLPGAGGLPGGHEEDLEEILRVVDRAHSTEQALLVRVVGSRGAGKSRLLRALEDRLRPRRVCVVRVRAVEGGLLDLWAEVLEALEPLLEEQDGDRDPSLLRARRALEAGCPRWEDEGGRMAWRTQLVRPWLRLPRTRPGVLLVDDLHRADRGTWGLVEFLVGSSRRLPLAVVATMSPREGEGLPGDSLPPAARVERHLPPPGEDLLAGLVREARPELGEEAARDLVRRCGADPVRVGEWAEWLARGGDPGASRAPSPAAWLPEGVGGTLLSLAEALGEPVDPRVLAAVLRRPAGEVREELLRCARAGWLEPCRKGCWRFAGPAWRERARRLRREPLTAGLLREGARALAALASGEARTAPRLERLYRQAGEPEEALRYAFRAAVQARSVLAFPESLEAWRRIAEHLESAGKPDPEDLCRVLLEEARTCRAAGREREAGELLERALAAADRLPPALAAGLHFHSARAREAAGELAEAEAAVGRALEILARPDPESIPGRRSYENERQGALCRLLLSRLIAPHSPEEALGLAERALEEARLLPDPVLEAEIHLHLCRHFRRKGDLTAAVHHAEAGEEAAGRAGEPDMVVRAGLAAAVLALEGHLEPQRCLAACRSVLPLAAELGHADWLSRLHTLMARAYSERGEWARAEDCYRQALAVQQRHGLITELDYTYSQLGEVALIEGDLERAAEYLAQSLRLAQEEGDRHTFFLSKCGMGRVRMAQGATDEARRLFHEALDSATLSGDAPGRARAHNYLADTWNRARDPSRARREAEAALVVARDAGDRLGAGLARRNLARAALLEGRTEEARRHLQTSLAILSRSPHRYEQAITEGLLGELLCLGPGDRLGSGEDLDRGLAHLESAERALSQMGDFAAVTRIQELQNRVLELRGRGT